MKKILPLLFISVLFISACAPTPQPFSTLPPQAFPSSLPTQPPCSQVSAEPTPIPGVESRFPGVGADDWAKGPADAAVTFIIYNDFQCVECNDQLLTELAQHYPRDVRLVYRHFPQPGLYDKALLAAQAAEAAGAQGHFWDMHDLLFAKQSEWVALQPEEFQAWAAKEAANLGLDMDKFNANVNDPATLLKVQKAMEAGKAAGIPVLPLILLNGEIYSAPKDFYSFNQVIRLTALGRRKFTACPQMTIDPARQYIATLKTNKGDIVIELYADKTPIAVNSFVFLARNGWYDNIAFYSILPGVLALTGDPSETGLGGPGYLFRDEIVSSLRYDKPGMVGMANSGPGTNGSQFFITFTAQPGMNGRSTIFGHVINGMEVLAKIQPYDPTQNATPNGDIIINITIEER